MSNRTSLKSALVSFYRGFSTSRHRTQSTWSSRVGFLSYLYILNPYGYASQSPLARYLHIKSRHQRCNPRDRTWRYRVQGVEVDYVVHIKKTMIGSSWMDAGDFTQFQSHVSGPISVYQGIFLPLLNYPPAFNIH